MNDINGQTCYFLVEVLDTIVDLKELENDTTITVVYVNGLEETID